MKSGGKGNTKSKQELIIETKLKFFICSIAFNGSDGFKLPNLNDINQDYIIREEEPCCSFEKWRYSCEPTPFLVSACLIKKLKKHLEPGFNGSLKSPYRRRTQGKNRLSEKKQEPGFSLNCSSKTVTVIPSYERRPSADIITRYKQISQYPGHHFSVLKQLLIDDENNVEKHNCSKNIEPFSRPNHVNTNSPVFKTIPCDSFSRNNSLTETNSTQRQNCLSKFECNEHNDNFSLDVCTMPWKNTTYTLQLTNDRHNSSFDLQPGQISPHSTSLNDTTLTVLSAETITKSLANVGNIDAS